MSELILSWVRRLWYPVTHSATNMCKIWTQIIQRLQHRLLSWIQQDLSLERQKFWKFHILSLYVSRLLPSFINPVPELSWHARDYLFLHFALWLLAYPWNCERNLYTFYKYSRYFTTISVHIQILCIINKEIKRNAMIV